MQHSKMLFVDQETTAPIKFFMRPSSEKAKLRPLIEHGGGIMATKCGPDTIRLVEPGTRVLSCDYNTLSTKYILDCVERNMLLEKSAYRVRIHGVSYSDISEEDSMYQIRTTERNLKPRKEYSAFEDEKILNYIIKTKRYSDVKGNRLWKSMANSGTMGGRSWQSLKERFLKKIARNLNWFDLTENQLKYFSLTLGFAAEIPYKRQVVEKKQTTITTDDFTEREVWAIFRYISVHFVHEDINGDDMWIRMEKSGVTSHPWNDMKKHFFEQVVPNIGKYHLNNMEIKRLSKVIDLPSSVLNRDETQNDDIEEDVSSINRTDASDSEEGMQREKTRPSDSVPYTQTEIWALFDYLFKHLVYEDIQRDVIWKKMEQKEVTRRSWQSMKNTFFNKIVPNIHQYHVPKHQVKRLMNVITLPDTVMDYDTSTSETSIKEENACSNEDKSQSKLPRKNPKRVGEVSFSEKESSTMLHHILNVLSSFDNADKQSIADFMWRKMEDNRVVPYTALSMKYHFFHHILPNIEKYNLSKEDQKLLASLVDFQANRKDCSQGEGSCSSEGDGLQVSAPKEQLKSLRLSLGAKLNGSPQKSSISAESRIDCLDRELLKNLHLPPLEGAEKTINWFLAPEQHATDTASCRSKVSDGTNRENPRLVTDSQKESEGTKDSFESVNLQLTPSDSDITELAPVVTAEYEVILTPEEVIEEGETGIQVRRRLQSSSEDDVGHDPSISSRSLRRKRRCTILSDLESDSATSGGDRLANQENYVPPPPKQKRSTSKRTTVTGKRQTLIERNSSSSIDVGATDCATEDDRMKLEEENRGPISTNSIVLMETAKEGVSDLLDEVREWLVAPASDGVTREDQLRECCTKLAHLHKVMNRALLCARVERIMDKSPNYMSFEDKLALYKFVTFCRT